MKIGAKMKANKIQQMGFNSVFHLLAVLLVVNALFFIVSPPAEASSPEIVRVFPADNATNVPTGVYLELEFSEPMDRDSVMDSTLRMIDTTDSTLNFNLRLDTATASGLIQVNWYDSPRGVDTLLKMQAQDSTFSLAAGRQYQVQIVDNKATDVGGYSLNLAGAVDLNSGFQFTVSSDSTLQYPRVILATPAPGAAYAYNVPTSVYLELGFSQPMDPGSVLDSTLRITDVSGRDDGDDIFSTSNPGYYFDIQIRAALAAGLVDLTWNSSNTIVQLTADHQLAQDNDYKLQMVDNKAVSSIGIPLILGGTINLLDGIAFQLVTIRSNIQKWLRSRLSQTQLAFRPTLLWF